MRKLGFIFIYLLSSCSYGLELPKKECLRSPKLAGEIAFKILAEQFDFKDKAISSFDVKAVKNEDLYEVFINKKCPKEKVCKYRKHKLSIRKSNCELVFLGLEMGR